MTLKNEQGPLTEAVYYILLSLFEPLHGYGIMQHIKEISGGRLLLGAGTLYGAMNSLVEKGWITELQDSNSSRKKEYLITDMGKVVVGVELLRLKELIENGERISAVGGETK